MNCKQDFGHQFLLYNDVELSDARNQFTVPTFLILVIMIIDETSRIVSLYKTASFPTVSVYGNVSINDKINSIYSWTVKYLSSSTFILNLGIHASNKSQLIKAVPWQRKNKHQYYFMDSSEIRYVCKRDGRK